MEQIAFIPHTGSPPAARQKIDALTGLRFFAAAMIVIHHSRGVLCIPKSFLPGFSLQHGVSFFFVLSGFILAYVYRGLSGPRATARFLIARFARIWPAHAFALCAALLLGIHEVAPRIGIGLANLAMIHAWVPKTAWFFSFNSVSWSISTEFFFYFAFPLLIAAFHRTWWWKMLIAAGLVALMVGIASWLALPSYVNAPPDAVNRAGILYIGPLARLFEFVLGIATAHLWFARGCLVPAAAGKATLLEVACAVLCAGAVLLFSAKAALISTLGAGWASYFSHAGAAPAFALLIFVFASQRGALSRLFAHPLAVLLGEISFSVYLLHQLMIRWILDHRGLWAGVSEAVVFTVFCAALLLVSWLVWKFIETPARRAIMRLAPAP